MTDPIYRSAEWRIVRQAVLKRDQYRCQIRLEKCQGTARAVDHIVDWRDGGPPYDPTNLRAACTSCNVSQRNTRVAARARATREQPRRSRAW